MCEHSSEIRERERVNIKDVEFLQILTAVRTVLLVTKIFL